MINIFINERNACGLFFNACIALAFISTRHLSITIPIILWKEFVQYGY